jgi:gas vesicle protein
MTSFASPTAARARVVAAGANPRVARAASSSARVRARGASALGKKASPVAASASFALFSPTRTTTTTTTTTTGRRGLTIVAKASDGGGNGGGVGKFLTGFLIGGAVCGVAGVLFAPQLSKTFLKGKDSVGKFLYEDYDEDDDDSLERTRRNLNDKIAQLNSAIDNFSTEADRGLSDKISKLNGEVEKLEKNAEGGAEAAA